MVRGTKPLRCPTKRYPSKISPEQWKQIIEDLSVIDPECIHLRSEDSKQHLPVDELLFAQELAKTPNQPQEAMKRAGVHMPTSSRTMKNGFGTWKQKLVYIIQNPAWQIAYQQALYDRIEATKVTQDKLINRLSKIAFMDKADIYDEHDTILPVRQMPYHIRTAISKIKKRDIWGKDEETKKPYIQGQETEIEFYNAMDAMKELGKYIRDTEKDVKEGSKYIQNNYYGDINNNQQNNIDLSNLNDEELQSLSAVMEKIQIPDAEAV